MSRSRKKLNGSFLLSLQKNIIDKNYRYINEQVCQLCYTESLMKLTILLLFSEDNIGFQDNILVKHNSFKAKRSVFVGTLPFHAMPGEFQEMFGSFIYTGSGL